MSISRSPLISLQEGHWFKLICGASYHHLPAIRNLALAYTLAGADCIDLAADPAIVAAARAGVQAAVQIAAATPWQSQPSPDGPWLMVSLNDGEDPHFRKAAFNPAHCPTDCTRPCESICPAQAIAFASDEPASIPKAFEGVIDQRCYGCGRCLPVCPFGRIYTRSYVSTPDAIAAELFPLVDAVEIHTQIGREQAFQRLWQAIHPWVKHLKLVAISCPDGEGVIEYLQHLWAILSPLPVPLIWQTDGRPMSGDIGAGTTTAAIRFGQKVLGANLPGYVQLAGGTNHATVPKLRSLQLLRPSAQENPAACQADEGSTYIAGVAYGSYARKLLVPVLDALESTTAQSQLPPVLGGQSAQRAPAFDKPVLPPAFSLSEVVHLEDVPTLFTKAVQHAASLVTPLKEARSSAASSPQPPDLAAQIPC